MAERREAARGPEMRRRTTLSLVPAIGAVVLAGCSSMSGLDAKNSFSCKAPEGVLCESMTGIYANARANNLPSQRVNRKSDAEVVPPKEQGTGVLTKPVYSGTPIRSAPQVLRVWFAPWEDTDGDLHDQSYVYLPVDSGKWLIEHNRRRIQDAYRPVRAPNTQPPAADMQRKIKATPLGQEGGSDSGTRPPPQTAAELLNGFLKPGMPGSPAQSSETE
jgi:conjugal transfer pilus assembly protein TraV